MRPKIISLFSGAGGLDYGFEAAGFDTAVALELDPIACETLRRNRQWPVVECSIFDVPTCEILKVASLKVGEADLLIGGPPCQPFSKSGYWARGDSLRLNDPRAATLAAYLRVLEEARPRAFVLENVPGLAYSQKDEGLRLLLKAVGEINRRVGTRYVPSPAIVHAREHGVPQDRSRFVMVAARDGRPFVFPRPSFGHLVDAGPLFRASVRVEPYRTAWDALGDLPSEGPTNEDLGVRGKWARLLPSIPEGQNYLWHTNRGGGAPLFGWRRRYWNFLLKLAKDRPAWTLQAQPGPAVGPFHWTSRRLSMRELCRLQTFPDDVEIVGARVAVQRQVGNAVPSLLAEVLGREIRVQLLGLAALNGPPRLQPPRRSAVPPPEPVARVPKKFLALAGKHDAHPGTGKGYAALARSRGTLANTEPISG